MKKSNSNKNSNEKTENNVFEDFLASPKFCEVCFIAFGSQEPRVFIGSKLAHLDCAQK